MKALDPKRSVPMHVLGQVFSGTNVCDAGEAGNGCGSGALELTARAWHAIVGRARGVFRLMIA